MSSSAVAVRQGTSAVAEIDPGSSLSFRDMMQLAEELVPTGFLPAHIQKPGQCVAIMLTGRELGMQPMRALRSLQMVKGKVIENADSQLARFKKEGGHAAFSRLDDISAILALRHPNGDEHVEEFSIADAKRAGLLSNGNWQKFPRAMLRSRAITAGLKSLGWEGGVGLYDPDEALEFGGAPANTAETRKAMTIEAAFDMPLKGKAGGWGGKAGSPLQTVSTSVLVKAIEFFRGTPLAERPNDVSLLDQIEALRVVLTWRAGEGDVKAATWLEEEAAIETSDDADATDTDVDFRAGLDEDDDEKQGRAPLPFRSDSEGGAEPDTAAATTAEAKPAKAVILALPADLKELKRWSSAQLQAKLLDMLKDPVHRDVKAKYLAECDAGMTHHQLVTTIGILVERQTPPAARRNARGEIGTLPGEHD